MSHLQVFNNGAMYNLHLKSTLFEAKPNHPTFSWLPDIKETTFEEHKEWESSKREWGKFTQIFKSDGTRSVICYQIDKNCFVFLKLVSPATSFKKICPNKNKIKITF